MRLSVFTPVMTVLLACATTVGAATPAVHDEGGFFKPETITAANKIISDIKRDDKKDLVVETFLHVPEGKEKEARDSATEANFFTRWADQQATDAGVKGVYVLICKQPSYLKIVTDNQTAKSFTLANRVYLDQILLEALKNKKPDDGLLEGVRYVQTSLKDKSAEVADHVQSNGVHDAAGFFKPDAITKANEIISAIKRDDKKDLLIQTYLHPPAGKEQEAKDADTKANFFKQWADQLGREQKVNGIVVLICKDPSYLKVVADNRTAKVFNEEARNQLSKILKTQFKNNNYDDGLLEGVRYVQTMLKGKASAEPTSGAAGSPWGIPGAIPRKPVVSLGWAAIGGLLCVGLFVIITIGVVLMGIMAIFRSFRRGPSGYGGPGGYGPVNRGGYGGGGYGGYGGGSGGGQGGGFLSSMLGGLFGGAAGGWAYDRFFGGHQGQAPNPTPREYGAPPPQQDAGITRGDDAGGGGDFGGGDTGGGADFGGGDAGGGDTGGGGDFGGGDTGGGGDFGGGGGDTGGGGSF